MNLLSLKLNHLFRNDGSFSDAGAGNRGPKIRARDAKHPVTDYRG